MSLPDSSNKDFFKALLDEVSNCLDQDWDSQKTVAEVDGTEAKRKQEQKATVLQIASNVLNIKNVAQNRTEAEVFKAVANMGHENAHLEVRFSETHA